MLLYHTLSVTKKLPLEKINISEECLWGNCHTTVYSKENKMHNVLNMKEWQLSDINVIKDLKINNGIIDEKYIFDKLKSKNNWIVQMMLVKNAVKSYIKIIDSNNPSLAADGLSRQIKSVVHKL